MKSIGQKLMRTTSPLLTNENLSLNWTYTLTYSNEEALALCEELLEQYERQEEYSLEDARKLSIAIESKFLERTENYWTCVARLNALATRLPRKKSIPKATTLSYPINIEQLPDHLYEISSSHSLFGYGRAAREWMMEQLQTRGQATLDDETLLLATVEQAMQQFEELWREFTAVQSFEDWKQVMEKLELDDALQTKPLYSHFSDGQPWRSLTAYQKSLKKEIEKSIVMKNEDLISHTVPSSSFMKGLYPTQWFKL